MISTRISESSALDFETLEQLRKRHPAWRLLCSDNAPLIAAFLHKAFIESNQRFIAESNLTESLEDLLYELRERLGTHVYPRTALQYLNEWAATEHGWLRKFYQQGSDEPHFDLTAATERALTWLVSLNERTFVGTESRLLSLFELLRQMNEGTDENPERRLAELQKRRDEIDLEMSRIAAGDISILPDSALRDRFQQFTQMARELLTDFREVEANFRALDRQVREKITLWEGSKSMLLEEVMGERDLIDDSDQGRSFHAFWDFLMSSRRQEELDAGLENILSHPAIQAGEPDPRLRRIHYDWLEAGEHTQRTVAELSKQLRRFLDDQAWLENRRIMELLHGIESKSIAIRDQAPGDNFMEISETRASIDLSMERPLYTPTFKPDLQDTILRATGEEVDTMALYALQVVDKNALHHYIRQTLQTHEQISLGELIRQRPLEHGLAELVVYFDLGINKYHGTVDEMEKETIQWSSQDGSTTKTASFPRLIFLR